MAFAVEDFHDLVRLLEEHPQWRAELRQLVLSQEVLELPALVRRLAEAQERAAGRLEGVETRLDRVEAALERLAQAQERAEGRLDRVEAALERLAQAQGQLAQAQAQTEERLVAMAKRTERLQREVGALAELVGARAELDAERVLLRVLQERGYRVLGRPEPVAVDGELDVAVGVTDAEGRRFTAVVEAKARLRPAHVAGWRRRLRDQAFRDRLRVAGFRPPFLPYAFGLRVFGPAATAGEKAGIGVLDANGELVAPVAMPV